MANEIVISPTKYPLHLTEVKNYIRQDDTADDDLITGLIAAATHYVEDITNQHLVEQTWEKNMDSFPDSRVTELEWNPVIKVNSVKYDDDTTDDNTWATSNYSLDKATMPARVVRADGISYPSIKDEANVVRIEYVNGILTPFSTTNATNVIDITAHNYTDGDRVVLSNSGGALPAGYFELTNYFVVNSTADTFQLSLTSGGSAVTISDDGTGNHYLGVLSNDIKQALLMIISSWYDCRGDSKRTVPNASDILLAPHRVYQF